ncbi:MAG TPA: hypothetical protein VNX28_10465 [Gemmataceae bacterium]|nr:hypothetical protein [Gemmataceae bacterium]
MFTRNAPRLDHASAYFAINAVALLTGKDVRNQPVEEMDVGKTRQRVLNLLKGLEMK